MNEHATGTRRDVLVFASRDGLYAIESSLAAEVVTPEGLTPLPGARPHVRGVFSHRGEIVPVIELGALFGLLSEPGATADTQDDSRALRAVLVRAERGSYALLATRVVGVESHEVEPQPVARGGLGSAVRPPVERDGQVVTVIDVEGLFALLAEGR